MNEDNYYVRKTDNTSKDLCLVNIATDISSTTQQWPYDTTDCFSYSLYLDVDESYLNTCVFSSAIVKYTSLSENIAFDLTATIEETSYDTSVGAVNETCTYRVGDVIKDNRISLDDASAILSMISWANEGNQSSSVSNINNLINAKVAINSQYNWATMFPGLVLDNGYACAEIANTDNSDSIINRSDADKVTEYYSGIGAGITVDEYVNSIQNKTYLMFEETNIEQ